MSAIDAYFVSFNTSRDGSTLRLVFELPTERTADVMQVLGPPNKDGENWCAIAKLQTTSQPEGKTPAMVEPTGGPTPRPAGVRESRVFTLSNRAAALCRDKGYWKWLNEHGAAVGNEHTAAEAMRRACGVGSRAEFDIAKSLAQRMFLQHEAEFNQWAGRLPRSA